MKGIKGCMNIDFEEIYEQETDTYYVSFRTGEPSYAIEVDDVLIMEAGIFTNMPTGFRILNFKSNPVQAVRFIIEKIKKTTEEAKKEACGRFRVMENCLEKRLEKTLAQANA
ncbi:MAG: hypothetical protein PHG87_00795 [Candidatus Omnitrophica bacterium]|nr:hypothetical protein [Candidatus Omnitrophota bacterium]